MKVLLIEEDRLSAFELAQVLEPQSIEALIVHDLVTAESITANLQFDVILLNVELLKRSNFSCLTKLRLTANTPVILLASQGLESQCIKGLEVGATTTSPNRFNPRRWLLVSTLSNAEALTTGADSPSIHWMTCACCPGGFRPGIGDSRIELTPAECRLLRLLMTTKNNPLPRHTLPRRSVAERITSGPKSGRPCEQSSEEIGAPPNQG